MNVLLVSQCNKRALVATRRILDHFAERKGDRTWQTAITLQGLNTLRQMLRRSARKNTAVACHWIKSANRTELLWIVGNMKKFNDQGTVPTNTTGLDVLKDRYENLWNHIEQIALMSSIAGLFHDFGKANELFQKKLKPKFKGKRIEPYRHEWVSLCLFRAFVGDLNDEEWVYRLLSLDKREPVPVSEILKKGRGYLESNPLKNLPPLATAIGWLILSHHRLPKWLKTRDGSGAPRLGKIERWMSIALEASWNSPQLLEKWSSQEFQAVFRFKRGLPFLSASWCAKAVSLGKRIQRHAELLKFNGTLMDNPFRLHLARMVLMLSDHYYSGLSAESRWQDPEYKAYANTQSGNLNQKLDEHLVGVGHNAYIIARNLPGLRGDLPSIARHRGFIKRTGETGFRWQNKAYELACAVREKADKHGFFGVNMASTGRGKTFANARIMYGLSSTKSGCRFNIALGLRTLTLQTGSALQKLLGLNDDDLAILIGSRAVRDLHTLGLKDLEEAQAVEQFELFSSAQYVRYEGTIYDGRLRRWLDRDKKLKKLVSAPILVSTIDYLMPATEAEYAGRQIAPMLRLLTSDLVLDEPDDFGLRDLYALTRLVNWAGMLGAKLLVSSATLPPALVHAMFDAYLSGRRHYQESVGDPSRRLNICCAWFDEYGVRQIDCPDFDRFKSGHFKFTDKRSKRLKKATPLRKAKIMSVIDDKNHQDSAIESLANTVRIGMYELHTKFRQKQPDGEKHISVGIVRLANINPMVALAKQLLKKKPESNSRIHYCVYHSQYPMFIRSAIERQLDNVLTRHKPELIWQCSSIKNALQKYPENDHIFMVLATPVAEVGRDHDYDWAIVEPSSMRAIIQIAGRVQRHRQGKVSTENILLLSKNYRALNGQKVAFEKPGFETESTKMTSHVLAEVLNPDQYSVITSIPRIIAPDELQPKINLVDLEHYQLVEAMFGGNSTTGKKINTAALWWRHNAHWCFELQRRRPFRASAPDEEFVLYAPDDETLSFHSISPQIMSPVPQENKFDRVYIKRAEGNSLWGNYDEAELISELADDMNMDIEGASLKFGRFRLRKSNEKWNYNSFLGIHKDIRSQ